MADEVLTLPPRTTFTGLMELMMIHETRSPLLPGYDKEKALLAMRLMRQCIENRVRYAQWFGGTKDMPPGPDTELVLMKNRQAFGEFANTPNFSFAFIHDANDIIRLANEPKDRRYEVCHEHVKSAIKATTEASPPADAVNHRVYYWRTENRGGPKAATAYAITTVQGNTFWGQHILDH